MQTRLVLLPQLLAEAYSYMHACLCASTLARKLYLLPFHRDVRPTRQLLSAMQSALQHCKQVGGLLGGLGGFCYAGQMRGAARVKPVASNEHTHCAVPFSTQPHCMRCRTSAGGRRAAHHARARAVL